MAPTPSPSTSTRALATRCTTALMAPSREDEAELARQTGRRLEVSRAVAGLVQEIKVAPAEAYAAETVGAPAATHGAHQVGAPDAAVAFQAVLAGETPRGARAMGAIGAVGAAPAVVAPRQALRGDAEGALAASL